MSLLISFIIMVLMASTALNHGVDFSTMWIGIAIILAGGLAGLGGE